jgi:hypothetical protein
MARLVASGVPWDAALSLTPEAADAFLAELAAIRREAQMAQEGA